MAQHFIRAHVSQIPPEDIFKQLKKEYGHNVKDAIAVLNLRSAEEHGGEIQRQKKSFINMNQVICKHVGTGMPIEEKRKFVTALRQYLVYLDEVDSK